MKNRKLKVGFIGGGINSAVGYAHYCASHLDGNFELIAGAFSRNSEINKQSAEQYGVRDAVYDDWQELIKYRSDLDAVIILTPTPAHQKMLEQCLSYDLPVICEKAVTTNSDSCRQLIKQQKKYNGFVNVTYNYSGYPMVRELKALINKGEIGDISHIQVEMPQEGFARLLKGGHKPCPQSWRTIDQSIPTIYLDLAVHLHHLVHYTTGLKPLSTIAQQNSYGWFDDIVDDVSAMVEYEKQVKCQYWFSKSSLGHRNGLRIKIYGKKSAVEWIQTDPERLKLDHINGRSEILERGSDCLVAEELRYNRFKAGHPSGFIEAFANLYSDFAHSITNHQTNQNTSINLDYGLDISLQGLNLLESMVKSNTSKHWEQINHG
ncbi:MAG: Gfo/Idh/MocA family oxidoreductase [Gammaproteobacteria bacterium]|nr:Gfo/Idh/MocA family oxidoreductase [Gammaproteobacteria bacterium]